MLREWILYECYFVIYVSYIVCYIIYECVELIRKGCIIKIIFLLNDFFLFRRGIKYKCRMDSCSFCRCVGFNNILYS